MAYNILAPVVVFEDVSMASTVTSEVVHTKFQDNIGIQLDWTGTPTGTFAIQISSNHLESSPGVVQVPGTWVTLPLSPAIAATGAADTAYIDLNQMSAQYVRVVYARTGGTGVLNGIVVGKAI
jgi:hypothetical protein